jgi:hypothetical protein
MAKKITSVPASADATNADPTAAEVMAEGAATATEPEAPVALVIAPAPIAALPAPAAHTAVTSTYTAMTGTSKAMEKAMKAAEDIVTFGQGNIEAAMKSGQIFAAGLQDIGKQVAASTQAQIDQTMAAVKAITQAKSFKEAVDLQSSHARSTVEKVVAETGKLTDASLKLAEQTMAPLTARVTLAFERFGRTA